MAKRRSPVASTLGVSADQDSGPQSGSKSATPCPLREECFKTRFTLSWEKWIETPCRRELDGTVTDCPVLAKNHGTAGAEGPVDTP